MMTFLNPSERRQASVFSRIGYTNPFLPERLELEQQVLGNKFQAGGPVIHLASDPNSNSLFKNFDLLVERCKALVNKMRERVVAGKCKSEEDQHLYREAVIFHLYGEFFSTNQILSLDETKSRTREIGKTWTLFQKEFDRYLYLPDLKLPGYFDAAHCFSIFFQISRAFLAIFECIIGSSMAIAKLRAAIWESIFTHDMRRYVRGVYKTMSTITTLITGPSGTGKELVARAIGLSQYQAFDPAAKKFTDSDEELFFAVNLSALTSTLIESELFGHCKGSFTGAVADRKGWLQVCGPSGTVFLDEIGELEHAIQVKLLRVLQIRTFSSVGDTKQHRFLGKFIAATNRDLAAEIERGSFREDLYYRLCADMIRTPSLQEQLHDYPGGLIEVTRFIAGRILIELPEEAELLAAEATRWIEQHYGSKYDWPGNFRELEQCVRNVLIRKSYTPSSHQTFPTLASHGPAVTRGAAEFVKSLLAGELSLEEVTEHYASLVYAQVGRYDVAARRLGVDWRTVKDKVREDLINKLKH